MRRIRLWLLLVGIPGLLAYATLVAAQWGGGRALASFERLQKEVPPDVLRPAGTEVTQRKMGALARASRLTPSDPLPAYHAALLQLLRVEAESLSPEGQPVPLGSGPDPRLKLLLREGLRSIRRAILLNPGSAESHFVAALLLQNLIGAAPSGQDAESQVRTVGAHLGNSDHLDPFKPSLHYRIGAFQMALGAQDEAKRAFTLALSASPGNVREIFDILWSTVSRPEEMGEFIGDQPKAHLRLGEFLFWKGYSRLAEGEFAKALAADPIDFDTGMGVISYYLRAGRIEDALRLIGRLEKKEAKSWLPDQKAVLEYRRGRALHLGGRFEEAISAYRRSLELDDTPAHVHHQLALAYLMLEDPDRAIARWRYLLDSRANTDYVKASRKYIHRGLASAYEAKGDYPSALIQYLRVVDLAPGDAELSKKILEISRKMHAGETVIHTASPGGA